MQRAQALAAQDDPRVVQFLRGRLDGLAADNAVHYLYDLRALATGALATVEVYRYPSGPTPEQVVTEVVVPLLRSAGVSPVRGEADLPAGAALRVTTQAQPGGQALSDEQYVLPVGPTTVSLSATAVGRPSEDLVPIVRSLRAG